MAERWRDRLRRCWSLPHDTLNMITTALLTRPYPACSMLFSSGMSAITTALLTRLRAGDHIVAPAAVYGGTHEWLCTFGERLGIQVSFVDGSSAQQYEAAIRDNTTGGWPCLPEWRCCVRARLCPR